MCHLPCLQAASPFSGPSRHPPLGHPFCQDRLALTPSFRPNGGCCPAPPQPHEHHALLPRRVRCPRPPVLSGFDRLFFCGSLRRCPIVADCSTTSAPHPLQRLRGSQPGGYRSPGGGLPPTGPATRSRDPLLQLRPTPQGEDIAQEIAARDRIKEGLICVLRCRSTRTTAPGSSRSATSNASASTCTTTRFIPSSVSCTPAFRRGSPSASTSVSMAASGLPARWIRPSCTTCVATTPSPGWKTSTEAQEPRSTSKLRANWRSCWTARRRLDPVPQPRARRRSSRGFPSATTGPPPRANGPAT